METLKEASNKLWVSQNALENASEAINYKEKKKKEANITAYLMRARRKLPYDS